MGLFDVRLFRLINGDVARHTPWLHTLLAGYALYGVALFAGLLLAGWWMARRHGPEAMAVALWAPVATLAAVAAAQPIAHLVAEPRPYVHLAHVLVLVPRSSDFSYPSDHATMAGAVATGLCLTRRRLLGAAGVVAAAVLAFARVYVGAHYPHDVAAGLALGLAVAVLGYLLLTGPLTRLVTWLSATPPRPLSWLRPLLTTAPTRPSGPAGRPPARLRPPGSGGAGSAAGHHTAHPGRPWRGPASEEPLPPRPAPGTPPAQGREESQL